MTTLDQYKNDKNQDWLDLLQETLVNPLREFGFALQQYQEVFNDNGGTHILCFEHEDSTKEYREHWIKNLMFDDDGQPESCYTLYMGTLFIFIPFFK